MIYNEEPDQCHASYMILSRKASSKPKWNQINAARRVSETVAKELVIQFVAFCEEPESFKAVQNASLSTILLKRWIPERDREVKKTPKNCKDSASNAQYIPDIDNDNIMKKTELSKSDKLDVDMRDLDQRESEEIQEIDKSSINYNEANVNSNGVCISANEVLFANPEKQDISQSFTISDKDVDDSTTDTVELSSLSQVELPELKQLQNLISRHISRNPVTNDEADSDMNSEEKSDIENCEGIPENSEAKTKSPEVSMEDQVLMQDKSDLNNISDDTVVVDDDYFNEGDLNTTPTDYIDVETVDEGVDSNRDALISYTRMMETSNLDNSSAEVGGGEMNSSRYIINTSSDSTEQDKIEVTCSSMVVNVDDIETAEAVSLRSSCSECSDVDVGETENLLDKPTNVLWNSEFVTSFDDSFSVRKRKNIVGVDETCVVKRFRHSTPRPSSRRPLRPSQIPPPTSSAVNSCYESTEDDQNVCCIQ